MSPTSTNPPTDSPQRRALMDAYLAGYEAYLTGVSPSRMPYPPSVEPQSRCRAWHSGYNQAKADRADYNRGANPDL